MYLTANKMQYTIKKSYGKIYAKITHYYNALLYKHLYKIKKNLYKKEESLA